MSTGPLDPETWRRVDALLDRALELPEHERDAFLERECGDDAELGRHVRELLAADARASEFLETPANEMAGDLLGPTAPPANDGALAPGFEVPPWRIVREIAHGGMGAVYLAERADGQFEQRAALKVIRSALPGDGSRERFLQERRILARLEHPRIARLLDGGFLPNGLPWFAMEYVDGTPITEYADTARLSVEQRVDLFAEVCEAVAHAQRHLVVHRDLKPSNVLVGADGKPKLLDFGIAKIFAGPEGEGAPPVDRAPAALTARRAALTRDGARLLTPEYAAPEQLRGDDVTTATDVWALGCLLFELLVGAHPYAEHLDTPGALERAVLTGDSQSLPRAVTEPAAAARATTTRALRRRLRGDLANIVARALARDPADRYPAAADLGSDLKAWRAGLPVAARAPSLRYRAAKAIARHRVAAGAGTAVLLALVVGLGAAAWQARRAGREADRATAVTQYLQSLFAEVDPDRAQGSDPRASELLARGAERLATELADQPELRAELLQTIGTLYESLGDYERASDLHRQALDLREQLFGPDDPRVAVTLGHLGATRFEQSDYESADSLLTRALAIQRRHLRSNDPQLATALGNLASVRANLGRAEEAEALHREAWAIDRAAFGAESEQAATDASNLAIFLKNVGRPEESVELDRETLAVRRKLHPGDDSRTATSLANLGVTLGELGRFDEAEAALREAIDMRQRLYPDGHRYTAIALKNLGDVRQRQDDLAAADSLYRAALEMSRRCLGEDHYDVANCVNSLAVNAYFRHDYDEAQSRFQDALARFERILPPGHGTLLVLRGNIATVALERGDVETAEREYRASIATRIAANGENDPALASDYRALGAVCGRRGRWRESEEWFRKALRINTDTYGDESEQAATTTVQLARAVTEQRRYDEAEAMLAEACATLASLLPEGHRSRVDADEELARTLLRAGRAGEALPGLQAALATRRDAFGDGDRKTAEAAAWTGECLAALGRNEEARALLGPAVEVLLARRGPDDPLTREAQEALRRAGG
ncbi:MAG: tetratricopeptide repeat protein [Gemmatimonadetes bacterium]|nr:tetratricopeptide repeat protein [Gemmatimonadota bacterium]